MKKIDIISSDINIHKHGATINWSASKVGFGQIYLHTCKESGKLIIDSEFMSKEFVKKIMEHIIEESIFSDFTTREKQIVSVTLNQANESFKFLPNVLHLPFHIEPEPSDANLIQCRWELSGNRILNIWFEKSKVEDLFTIASEISKNKTFSYGFVKAEIWDWIIKEKS